MSDSPTPASEADLLAEIRYLVGSPAMTMSEGLAWLRLLRGTVFGELVPLSRALIGEAYEVARLLEQGHGPVALRLMAAAQALQRHVGLSARPTPTPADLPPDESDATTLALLEEHGPATLAQLATLAAQGADPLALWWSLARLRWQGRIDWDEAAGVYKVVLEAAPTPAGGSR